MIRSTLALCIVLALSTLSLAAENGSSEKKIEEDIIKTKTGDLKLTFIGHGTLMLQYKGKVIHVDPWTRLADYSKMPKADLILITHEHRDHLDTKAIATIRTDKTKVVLTKPCAERVSGGIIMKNGDTKTVADIKIEAVPAYNIVSKRAGGEPYHPKGSGNGYVLNLDKTRVYIAGDTENIPEMAKLKKIDIAFLPMNQPYTMTPKMAAAAAKVVMPKILYPYHYSQTDPKKLVELLKDTKEIEVRIRKMQ